MGNMKGPVGISRSRLIVPWACVCSRAIAYASESVPNCSIPYIVRYRTGFSVLTYSCRGLNIPSDQG
jgi:hypothetical protein